MAFKEGSAGFQRCGTNYEMINFRHVTPKSTRCARQRAANLWCRPILPDEAPMMAEGHGAALTKIKTSPPS
jgi:hypothetical protein